ncbi:hypothetical protein TIFTF001_017276 [Ficus carica]|uniref:DUF1985 domain-containing protein n=1 Tax=Ficus carica TaxID=3494 RepID=A0AA88AKX3_FICCA|nr:hypothetical protein TIFTF001_017276 [Ficus carica]
MARSRMSSEMDSENDSKGVSRTNSQPDGNMSPQSTSVSIPRVLDLPLPNLKLNVDQANFKCKITIKHLLKDAVDTVNKALQDHPNGIEWYSLMEHALISGLNCSAYPEDPSHTRDEFRRKVFRGMKKISQNDVKKSLEGMVIPPEEIESNKRRRTNEIRDREKERSILINDKLKLAVLYFLCAVLRGPEKANQQIDDNLIKMIEDLDWCANYPWGRKTYQFLMTQVQKLDIGAKCKDACEKLARWNNHAFILPLMVSSTIRVYSCPDPNVC